MGLCGGSSLYIYSFVAVETALGNDILRFTLVIYFSPPRDVKIERKNNQNELKFDEYFNRIST